VSLDPADEWPHRLASNALVHLGNFPDALRAAHEARRLAPGYWQTHVCVAQAALAGQRLSVAAEAASQPARWPRTSPTCTSCPAR